MRAEARRRVIRLEIAGSPFAEVRAAATEIEQRVFARGNNPLSLSKGQVLSGTLSPERARVFQSIVVRQDLEQQVAMFVPASAAKGSAAAATLSLGDALSLTVTGASRPVKLCNPPARLDPSPCIDAADVSIDSPLAYVDRGGTIRLVDRMKEAEVAASVERLLALRPCSPSCVTSP